MTDDQHRRLGEILGYPKCCVEQWIRDVRDPRRTIGCGTERGSVKPRERSEEECRELVAKCDEDPVLGGTRDWTAFFAAGDAFKRYVPCDYHVSLLENLAGEAAW